MISKSIVDFSPIHPQHVSRSFQIGTLFAWHSSFSLIRFHLSECVCECVCARAHTHNQCAVICFLVVMFFFFALGWYRLVSACYYFDAFLFVVVVNVVAVALMCSSLVIIMISRFQCSSCVMHCAFFSSVILGGPIEILLRPRLPLLMFELF